MNLDNKIWLTNISEHIDHRGKLTFINDFDLKNIKRYYLIYQNEKNMIRAWQGHRDESKYFHIIEGSFKIVLLNPENWYNISSDLKPRIFILNASKPKLLIVPPGYINGIKALENDSLLLVFSDKSLDESRKDDYRWELNYFNCYREVFNGD